MEFHLSTGPDFRNTGHKSYARIRPFNQSDRAEPGFSSLLLELEH